MRSAILVSLSVALSWQLASGDLRSQSIQFAALGDFGIYRNKNSAAVAQLIRSWNPDFVITLGDNNYELKNSDPAKRSFAAVTGHYYCDFIANPGAGGQACSNSLTKNRFFPSLGNHDWEDHNGRGRLGSYKDYFDLPGMGYTSSSGNERYYDFVVGDVHFFVLSSNAYNELDGTTPSSKQGQWLQRELAKSTKAWQFVYFHKPPYTSSKRGAAAHMRWPFKQWGADVVMAGHDHFYERLEVDGIPYFVNGSGGGGITWDVPNRAPQSQYLYHARSGFGAMRITADAQSMKFEFVDITRVVRDVHVITKGPQAEVRKMGPGCINDGQPPILSATLPRLAGTSQVSVSSTLYSTAGIHLIGRPHGGFALRTGCSSYVDLMAPSLPIVFRTDPSGSWRSGPLPVGAAHNLLGLSFAWQSWFQRSGGPGYALSNGLVLTIGY